MINEILQHNYLRPTGEDIWPGGAGRADLVFADPPYNLGVHYDDDPSGDKLSELDYRTFVATTLMELRRVLRPGGTLWWMCPVEHADWIGDRLTQTVGPREYMIAWHETFAQYQGDRSLTRDFRLIYCHVREAQFGDGLPVPHGPVTFNPDAIRVPSVRQQMGDKRADPRGRVPGTVWKIRRLQGTAREAVDWHPNQLPPELLRRIIRGWTNPGDLVLDAFAGSGSLGILCKEEGRHFVGIDRSPTYCRRMRERIQCSSATDRGSPARSHRPS